MCSDDLKDAANDVARSLRSDFATSSTEEALRARAGALLGVTPAAEAALATLDVRTVFDLAVSRVFSAAADLLSLEQDGTAVGVRLNAVPSDVAQPPDGLSVRELARQPIALLRAIGEASAPEIAAALDVTTIRDLALWPPYAAARALLAAAFFPERSAAFDPEAPPDLLPKSGVYPTERVFFRRLVMDAVPEQGQGRAIELAEPIDLAAALGAPAGFGRLATGALLTFSQSWFSEGLTLGQLLHSTSLAPGESTRIAVVDWSRRTRAAASEDISEAELLSNSMTHSRAISEVTSATATEVQTGQSSLSSKSTTNQAGAGGGFELGPFSLGGSASTSTTTTDVMSTSSSFGARDLAAAYAQDINDRSQQNAAAVRNRRASVVREVSQSEHEQISTRVITNYNHMHALSIHHYEVVQAFRTTTQLERAERCLFVPVRLVDFSDLALVDRWRLQLADAALTERARRQLTVEYGVVEVVPQTPRIRPGQLVADVRASVQAVRFDAAGGTRRALLARARPDEATALSAVGGAGTEPGTPPPPPSTPPPLPPPEGDPAPPAVDYVRAPTGAPASLLALKGWDIEQLNRIGWTTGRILMQQGSDSVFVSDDALVVGFALREAEAARFVVRLRTGQEAVAAAATSTTFTLAAPLAIGEIESIAVQFAGTQDRQAALALQLNLLGTVMPLDVPVTLRPASVPLEVVKFGGVSASRELVAHLQANRLHYTQAVLRRLDAATVAALLSPFTYRGLPLGMLVDAQPIAISANFLVFKMGVTASGEPDDPRWADEQAAWGEWLRLHGLARPAPRSEIIPLPSGGVFAEAVLGRFNAAEKTDLTRFWNWQDSPIPLTAPEIAPLQAGSRATSEDLRPGPLSAPVVALQSPTALPDAAGIAAIVSAVQNGNMFRDMSGLAQTAAVAQAALQASAAGATAVGEQAAQNLKTVMENNTERMRIAAAAATGGASGLAGGGSASGGRPAKNVTEESARLNFARGLDAAGAGGGAGGRKSGATDVPSPQFGSSAQTTQGSVERALFDRQTGGVAANLADELTSTLVGEDAAAVAGAGATGTAGGGATPPADAAFLFPPSFPALARDTGKLKAAFDAALASVKADPALPRIDFAELAISIVALNLDGTETSVGVRATEMFFSGSLLKVAAMYAAFQLRHAVNQFAPTITAATPADFFRKVAAAFNPQIQNAVPLINAQGENNIPFPMRVPVYDTVFEATPDGSTFTVDFRSDPTNARFDFKHHLTEMTVNSHNPSAGLCIQALGLSWINVVLQKAGFFRGRNGIWLAGDYVPPNPSATSADPDEREMAALGLRGRRPVLVGSANDGDVKQVTTCADMANLFVRMAGSRLVDGTGAENQEMKDLLQAGVTGAAPSLLARVVPSPTFRVLQSKIGVGELKIGGTCKAPPHRCVTSEGSVIEHVPSGRQFVTVWQNLDVGKPVPNPVLPIAELIQRTMDNFLR
jgi:hypothetical protein